MKQKMFLLHTPGRLDSSVCACVCVPVQGPGGGFSLHGSVLGSVCLWTFTVLKVFLQVV